MQVVEQEVSQEVAAYKASRKADALQQLAGHLSEDTAAAARQLEQQTAELQRLEAAVADRAAVLQKLSDEVALKQREQLQQQQRLLDSLTGSLTGERCGDGQLLASCGEQLVSVQQQLAQAEKQLTAADSALVEKRAAVAEAEEQLAGLKRETFVCEPRLGSLRQQLQELEATIRARDAEQQVMIGLMQYAHETAHQLGGMDCTQPWRQQSLMSSRAAHISLKLCITVRGSLMYLHPPVLRCGILCYDVPAATSS
jgi:chromosome segregation ATPase